MEQKRIIQGIQGVEEEQKQRPTQQKFGDQWLNQGQARSHGSSTTGPAISPAELVLQNLKDAPEPEA